MYYIRLGREMPRLPSPTALGDRFPQVFGITAIGERAFYQGTSFGKEPYVQITGISKDEKLIVANLRDLPSQQLFKKVEKWVGPPRCVLDKTSPAGCVLTELQVVELFWQWAQKTRKVA